MPMKATIPSAILTAATLALCGCASGSMSAAISATPSKASDFSASAAYLGAKTGAAGSGVPCNSSHKKPYGPRMMRYGWRVMGGNST